MSALAQPAPANDSKQYPPKITNIVEEISKLTLIEVADLNELLKKTLNIQVIHSHEHFMSSKSFRRNSVCGEVFLLKH